MFTCLWVLSCPFGGPALAASHPAAGRLTSELSAVWSCGGERNRPCLGQLSSRVEGQRWFSFLLRKFSRKKLYFPSAGLPGHYPKLLVSQQLASCRFVGTILVFESRPPKNPSCLEISLARSQREREREAETETDRQRQTQRDREFGAKRTFTVSR